MKKVSHDSEVKAEGQQVVTACALIHRVRDGVNEVFMPKRADIKKFLPGVFELPGGHIDFGENIVSGLKREVFEEFGVEINVGDPFAVFDYQNDIKGSHSFEVVYFATLEDEKQKISLNPEDHSDFIWISEKEIDKACTLDKGTDDVEIKIVLKAFQLLNGEGLRFWT